MATTEEATLAQGIQVAIYGSEQKPNGEWYGPKGEAIESPDGDGYLVTWEDGFEDHPLVRWHFENTPLGEQYNLVRINEGE